VIATACRDCDTESASLDLTCCLSCGSTRVIRHPELDALTIAHLDCDAFYATIEKRDDLALRDQPVVVGGRQRGVVMAACYIARRYGIHSAMPMFHALERCPHVAVVKPNMAKYAGVGREVREMMRSLTPRVGALSIDEAFLDLSGTTQLHGVSPASSLAALARRIERELNITVSIGLSYNKFLAKMLSDLNKPRGFAVVGRADARDFLTNQPVRLIWGVGKVFEQRLARDNIHIIGQLRAYPERELVGRYGRMGRRLAGFAEGHDDRGVGKSRAAKCISAETTFGTDIADSAALKAKLRPLCDRLAQRAPRQSRRAGRHSEAQGHRLQDHHSEPAPRRSDPVRRDIVHYGGPVAGARGRRPTLSSGRHRRAGGGSRRRRRSVRSVRRARGQETEARALARYATPALRDERGATRLC